MSTSQFLSVGDSWRAKLLAHGIHPALAEKWSRFVRPRICLLPGELHGADETPIGASKLGGWPDLPIGTAWPVREPYEPDSDLELPEEAFTERPLRFLAQINLAEVTSEFLDVPLPRDGVLSFFYDAEVQPWGYKPGHRPGSRVLYSPLGAALRRVHTPDDHLTKLRTLVPERQYTVAPWQWLEIWIDTHWSDAPFNFYEERLKISHILFSEEFLGSNRHVLGGWPDIIQNTMERQCEKVTNGLDLGKYEPDAYLDFDAAARNDLVWAERAQGWRLLTQIASDKDLEFYWGDYGHLYFWARLQDIADRRFDDVWTILQCT